MNTVTEHDTQCGEEHFSNFYVEHNLDLMLTGFGIYNLGNIGGKKLSWPRLSIVTVDAGQNSTCEMPFSSGFKYSQH